MSDGLRGGMVSLLPPAIHDLPPPAIHDLPPPAIHDLPEDSDPACKGAAAAAAAAAAGAGGGLVLAGACRALLGTRSRPPCAGPGRPACAAAGLLPSWCGQNFAAEAHGRYSRANEPG